MSLLARQRVGLLQADAASGQQALRAATMVLLSVCGACLTGLLAQLRIPLPFTPVPITGQVFAVLVCGALLGSGYGALSQLIYVTMGVMGVPWFAGGLSGFGVLTAFTGGYLVGFVVAALFLGACTRRSTGTRTFGGQVLLMLGAVAILYFFGWLHLVMGLRMSPAEAAASGLAPFVLGDVLKVVVAARLTSVVLSSRIERAVGRR